VEPTHKPAESPFSKRFQREQKRQAILSEAARLFNIHGARATRLSDVAEHLDLNQASLYYYVKSKDDLIFQTYMASCASIEEMLDDADARGATGAQKLERFIRLYFGAWQAITLGQQPHFAILTEIRALKKDYRQQVADRYREMFGRIKGFIREGVEDSSLRPCQPTDAALAVFGLVQLTVLWLPGYEPEAVDRAADEFVDIVLHGIAARPAATGTIAPPERVRKPGADDALASMSLQESFRRVGSALFNRKGFKAASLDEIADELAVTKGAFYYHVKDKDDLLRQCFERSVELISTLQERAESEGGNGLTMLWRCIHHLFEVQTGPSGPLIRFTLIPSLASRHRKQTLADLDRVSDRFGALIRKGIADGSIRGVDPYIAEQILLSAIDLSAELPWMRKIADSTAACRSYFSFYFNGLAAPAGYDR